MLHAPLVLQDAAALPKHCFAPGVHTPVQAPLTHASSMHGCEALQVPVALQVCTPLFEHRFEPGVQTPVHAPSKHA